MRCGNNKQIVKIFLLICLCLFSGLSVACQSKPKDVASVLEPCQELVDKEELLAVGKFYNEQLAANPQFAVEMEARFSKSFFKKCLELKEKQNYEKAIVCLEGVSVLASHSANIQYQLARSYYEYNKTKRENDFEILDRAENAIKKSITINPDEASSHYAYGRILAQKAQFREAIAEYEKAIKLQPKTAFFWFELAITQDAINDTTSALSNYHQALMLEPENTSALYNSAKLYEKTGNIDQAISNFEKLLKIKKPYDDAEKRLENLKKQKNQPKEKTKSPEIYRGVPNNGTSTAPF